MTKNETKKNNLLSKLKIEENLTEALNIRLSETQMAALQVIAKKNKSTVAKVVRALIEELIEQETK